MLLYIIYKPEIDTVDTQSESVVRTCSKHKIYFYT